MRTPPFVCSYELDTQELFLLASSAVVEAVLVVVVLLVVVVEVAVALSYVFKMN